MLGFPILDCKGMRPMMFQLSGFCYSIILPQNPPRPLNPNLNPNNLGRASPKRCQATLAADLGEAQILVALFLL